MDSHWIAHDRRRGRQEECPMRGSMPIPPHASRLVVLAAIAVLLLGVAPAAAGGGGVRTSQAAMLAPVGNADIAITPLITVGEPAGDDGYRYEAIPDGISLRHKGAGVAEVFINHETARAPFPYNPTTPTDANSQNDFDNAQLSRLLINQKSGGVQTGKLVITSDQNYQRFCSNFLATAAQGFERELLFTNEETPDWTNRTGNAWPTTVGAPTAREAGIVVALDVMTGKTRQILGLGRLNHENSVAIPGFSQRVLMTGDDTFTNNPSQSQLYQYVASSAAAVWNDEGTLRAFVSDDPLRQKYEDFAPGDATAVSGHFIDVPKLIATGRKADGSDLMAADVPAELGGPYPTPEAANFAWQRDSVTGIKIDGPQWVLEKWSQLHHVFGFVRIEDIAYDKRPGMSNVVYVVDSGRGTAGTPGPGVSTNGRIWKMTLHPGDPSRVDAMSILIEGDDSPVKTVTEIHQPDNIESTVNGLYLQEDPGGSQQFPATSTDPAATSARIWQYPFATGVASPILKVDQGADGGSTDVDGLPNGNLGAWESTGIVDASAAFGPGAFLVNVQAHTLWVEKAPGADNFAPLGPDFTDKREGGQLLLIRIAGG
jgi:hypothetical protein